MGCRDHSALAECKDRVLRAHCRSRVPADFSNNATPRASRNHGAGPHRLPSACVAAGSRHWQVSFRAPALLFTRVQTPRERRGSATRGCTREPKHLARAHTESATPTLLSGSAGNTTTEKSHCHLQRGCKSAAARSFPRCSHFPHTLTFGLPQISSPIKKRISNTSVQKNLESGEHEDSAPRNAISKTKLPVCLCMGRTEEAGEVKGGKKKKNHRKQNLGDSFAPMSGLESLTFHAQQRPHGANCTRPTSCKHSLRQRRVQKDCLQQFFSCYRGRRYRFRFPSAQARLPGPNSLESS